ncbi:MAG: protein kinase [Kofleriaceae bacterium]|nr:protein kinase [Kofleriaceae bacterium]
MPVGDDDTVASSLPTLAGGQADIPEVIAGRYQLVRWLGGGGMGRVYEVLDTELGERVALKVLRSGLSEEAIERFRREVRLTRRIQHRNVARMFDIGDHNGDKFLTMELIDGEPLTRTLGAPLPWDMIQRIATQICAGLAAAHQTGVVHRDLKPDNVLIERTTQRAVITDFGIARSGDDSSVTQVGVVIGTPRYMAPEQLAGGDIDARADIFSLGVMLYELATATRPWSGDNPIHIAVAQATQPMRPLVASVPLAFTELVTACLSIDREKRPANAATIGETIAATDYVARDAPLPRAVKPTRAPTLTPSSAGLTAVNAETTIAVLPFQCADVDGYLADGLGEDLIDMLSTTAALRVRPAGVLRTAPQHDLREVGRQLGVDHVVSGSLRRTPAGLRVSARLLGVADGFQIWAHRAEISETEVLTLSEELGRGIAQALSTRAAAQTGPMAPAAVDLYLRARSELRRFWGEHAEEATKLLEQASAIAPGSGPILSTLAYASAQAWIRDGRPDLLPRAQQNVERGLASGHGEAHLAAHNVELNLNNHERAAHHLGLALARSPMSGPVHETAARLLIEVEHSDAGRRHIETAIGLDPGRTTIMQPELMRMDAFAGNWASVEQRVQRMITDPDPAIVQLGSVIEARLSMWLGDVERSQAALERVRARLPATGAFDLLALYRHWRATGEFDIKPWRGYVRNMFAPGRPQRPQLAALQRLAEVAATMKQDEAIELILRVAADGGLLDLVWLDKMPAFRRIAHEAWFVAIRAQVADRAARVLTAYRNAAAGVTAP